jgi:hypothetical protein
MGREIHVRESRAGSGVGTVQPALGETSLPERYVRAKQRLFSLERPEQDALEFAWHSLLRWRQQVSSRGDCELPVPAIFSNAARQVEFEWDISGRSLTLRLVPDGPFEFSRTDDADDSLVQTGQLGFGQVCPLLLWVLGE